jgi:hypothetical protein
MLHILGLYAALRCLLCSSLKAEVLTTALSEVKVCNQPVAEIDCRAF